MLSRLCYVGVLNPLGMAVAGAEVVIRHSSGRVIYDGQTDPFGNAYCTDQYESSEGGYLYTHVSCFGGTPAAARLVSLTIDGDVLAIQFITLYPVPDKGL